MAVLEASVGAGVTFLDTRVEAASQLSALAPAEATPDQAALGWIIQQPGVTTVIPGARNAAQANANALAANLPTLPDATLITLRDLYGDRIRAQVHDRW